MFGSAKQGASRVISAEREVSVSVDRARDWFLSLEDHPERYRFATHQGIEFVGGNFGDVGARFKTREKFYFLSLDLLFELVDVDDTSFRLRLVRPAWMDVWGVFSMRELSPGRVSLRLEIGSDTRRGAAWLKFAPVTAAVRQQIRGEVDHIKESMESAWGDSDGD
jgi:hypothetical protein